MKKKTLQQLTNLIVFNKAVLRSLNTEGTEDSLNASIARWQKSGDLILLKKGLYTTSTIWSKHSNDFNFFIFIANSLRYPSYVTGYTILSNHNVLTDITYGYHSFTKKITAQYVNQLGNFSYSNVKTELFLGYKTDFFLGRRIYYASKAKALFDFLYHRLALLPDKIDTFELLEWERLDLSEYNQADFAELLAYSQLTNSRKLKDIILGIHEHASTNSHAR